MNTDAIPWYPLTFRPVYKDYIWGGDRILTKFGRRMPPGIYAESWEVSTRPEGMSVVADGALGGATLQSLVETHGAALLGTRVGPGPFPLLVKLIDSRERLSVQVHPNAAAAARNGGEAKTEMWHVLDAVPGAQVFAGLKAGTGKRDMDAAIRHSRFEDVLATVPVAAGDTVFIPGGRVHALDAGLLILEVQQNSNTTYRLYDWGRVGHDGRPRETHVAQALRVIDWDDAGSPKVVPSPLPCPAPNALELLVASPYFRIERLALHGRFDEADDPGGFRVLFVASGALRLDWPGGTSRAAAGTSILIPAALRGVHLAPEAGAALLIRASVP
jgi:mannose-6-phosphate isomerase